MILTSQCFYQQFFKILCCRCKCRLIRIKLWMMVRITDSRSHVDKTARNLFEIKSKILSTCRITLWNNLKATLFCHFLCKRTPRFLIDGCRRPRIPQQFRICAICRCCVFRNSRMRLSIKIRSSFSMERTVPPVPPYPGHIPGIAALILVTLTTPVWNGFKFLPTILWNACITDAATRIVSTPSSGCPPWQPVPVIFNSNRSTAAMTLPARIPSVPTGRYAAVCSPKIAVTSESTPVSRTVSAPWEDSSAGWNRIFTVPCNSSFSPVTAMLLQTPPPYENHVRRHAIFPRSF